MQLGAGSWKSLADRVSSFSRVDQISPCGSPWTGSRRIHLVASETHRTWMIPIFQCIGHGNMSFIQTPSSLAWPAAPDHPHAWGKGKGIAVRNRRPVPRLSRCRKGNHAHNTEGGYYLASLLGSYEGSPRIAPGGRCACVGGATTFDSCPTDEVPTSSHISNGPTL